MSYILDALRRADAERERGNVPGLHTQPAPVPHADDGRTGRAPAWVWPAAGVALVVIAALAWLALGRDTAPPERGAGVAVAPVAPLIVPPQPLPAALPAPITAPAAVQPASAAPTPRAATAAAPRKPAAVVAAAPAKPPRAASATAAATAAATTPTVTTAESRLYKPTELPDDVRKEVLALVIGGAMYSQTPANRMLIVNGQLFHEGDTLAPGLTLEQIKLKSAVLKLKGYRVGIDY